MASALRLMSVQRGYDAEEFCLVSFGGAGGLHVCALAETLGMSKALVPIQSGVLSALGMLVAAPTRQASLTINQSLTSCQSLELDELLQGLESQAITEIEKEVRDARVNNQLQTEYTVDLRYQGQSFALNLAYSSLSNMIQNFHDLHEKRYGHSMDMPVELVTIRVRVTASTESLVLPKLAMKNASKGVAHKTVKLHGIEQKVSVYQRQDLLSSQMIAGPALINEKVSTTFIDVNWFGQLDDYGSIVLHRK